MSSFIVTTVASVKASSASAAFTLCDANGKLIIEHPMTDITAADARYASKGLVITDKPSCHMAAYIVLVGAMISTYRYGEKNGAVIHADFITTPLVADQINGVSKCKSATLQPFLARCQKALEMCPSWSVSTVSKDRLF